MDHKLEIILSAKDMTQKAFLTATAQVTRFAKSVFSMRTAMIGVAGAAGIGMFVRKSMDVADAIGKAADAMGIGTGTLQEYRHAARLSGVETGELDKSLQQFGKRVGEAKSGTGAMITFLKKFDEQLLSNIQKSKSTDEALDLVFKRMGQTASATDKAALANAAFGRSGIKMTVMVKEGAAGLAKMRQEARDLGIVMDDHLIRQSEKANDEIEKLTRVIKVQFMAAAVGLAPEIAKVAQHTTDWWKANHVVVKQDIAGWVKGVTEVVKIGTKPLQIWVDLWKRIGYKSGGGGAVKGMDYKSGDIVKPPAPEIIPAPAPKPAPFPTMPTGAADAAKKEHDALMKEVERAQKEFESTLPKIQGTWEIMQGQLGFAADQTREDTEKTKQAFESMYSDLRFQSAGYYDYRKAQLEKQAEDYQTYTGDEVLAHQWLVEQIKALDEERLQAAKKNNVWLVDMSERTADAIEDNFSKFYRDAFRGELDSAADYFRAFCHSLTDSFSDMLGQMTKEMMFGGGSSGSSGLFKSLFSGIGGWFGSSSMINGVDTGGTYGWGGMMQGFASGGKPDKNKFIVVGEDGPEIFYTGNTGGEIIPNHKIFNKENSSVQNLTISVPVNIDNISDRRLSARLQGEIERTVKDVMREEMR